METPKTGQQMHDAAISLSVTTRTTPPEQERPVFRMLIVGDFGRDKTDPSPAGLTLRGETPASLPEQFDVTIECSTENLLGSNPPRLEIRLPIRRFSDFGSRSISTNIEPLRRAAALRAGVASGYGTEAFADLDKLVAAVHGEPTATPASPSAAAGVTPTNNADLLQSMLGGGDHPAPGSSPAGLSSIIGTIARSSAGPVGGHGSAKDKLATLDAVVTEQLACIREHPRFAAIEAVWRGLQLLLRSFPRDVDTQLDLLDIPADSAAHCLLSEIVPDELERTDGVMPSCVLMLGAVPDTVEGIEQLAYCAAAGTALQAPVLVSLQQGFFDNFGAETAAAWALLRSDDHTRWIAPCYGELVLDTAERDVPLWGEPGWAVAGLIISSIVRTGWPTSLADPAVATVDGLELHELTARGAPAAWPLRQPLSTSALAELRALGVSALTARANRDSVFLPAAPMLANDSGEASALGERLLASFLLGQLRAATLVVGGESDEAWGEAIGSVLRGLLPASGRGHQLRVTPQPRTNPGDARGFQIELLSELPGLAGRRVAFDYWT